MSFLLSLALALGNPKLILDNIFYDCTSYQRTAAKMYVCMWGPSFKCYMTRHEWVRMPCIRHLQSEIGDAAPSVAACRISMQSDYNSGHSHIYDHNVFVTWVCNLPPVCTQYDYDLDGDVDLRDYSILQRRYK